MATVRCSELESVRYFGVRHSQTKEPIDADTVFEAASLSKPLVAFAVLRLVDAGKMSLDEPLSRAVPAFMPDDHRAPTIT